MEEEEKEHAEKAANNISPEETVSNESPIKEAEAEEMPLEDRVNELEDKLLRSAAEVENIRKRSEKERIEAYKVGISLFVKDFVPVLDNIERALSSIKDSDEINYESFIEGIKATDKDIISLLEKHGIQQINPIDEKFDPLLHEALFEAESEKHEAGFITQVIEVGYILDKRLIRPAKVGVCSKK